METPPVHFCPDCQTVELILDKNRRLVRGYWLGCPRCKDQFQFFDGNLRKVEPE
jgi:hypothetical protein